MAKYKVEICCNDPRIPQVGHFYGVLSPLSVRGLFDGRMRDMKIERECNGYTYTDKSDDDRDCWKVETDYMHSKVYLTPPDDGADLAVITAFGRAIVKACRDMRKETKYNRFDVV